MKLFERLVRGLWLPASNECLKPCFTTKASCLIAAAFLLEKLGCRLPCSHDGAFLAAVLSLFCFKLASKLLHIHDPFRPFESVFCTVLLGGLVDAIRRAAESSPATAAVPATGKTSGGQQQHQQQKDHGEENRRTPPPPDALNQQQWQPPSSARMKRAEPSSSGGGGPAAEESLMTVVQDMSRQLEEKADRLNLRSSSVRRIIKEVLSDQDVLDDVDLDADAVSASIQPSSQSQTQQQQPPPLLSTPPPSGAPLDDIGAVKAEDAAIFDEDDVEFRNFLRDIYLDRIEVADPPNEAEEDADFNVMAEPEEAYQEDFVEDLRYNRASRIPKREVRDLLDEICSDLFDSQLSAGRHLQQQAGASSPPQPLSQDDQEEATAEPECLLQPCAVEDLSQEQRVELRKQLTMYVQLLCTMRITCHQQSPELADSAKVHLNELKLLADAYEAANPASTSILRVANLDGAVSLADNFAGLSDTDLLVCYSRPSRSLSSRSDCTADELAESTYLMPPQLCNLFLTSSVFPYAQLFPPGMSASVCRSKRTVFTPSEDRLLLLGLTQFGHRRDVFQLISKYTMPWRSQVAISARCVYLSKLQSLLFRDSLCPARVLTRSLIISCLRRRQHLLSAASQPQAGKSAAPSSPPPDSKQSEPDSIDLNFCQSNWINSVPILTDCVLDRPADWCHLPQLFRQHLLLERPRLRGQLLKPTEPNPLERDTANDQANKLFKRCRILFKDMRHERLLGVRLLWRDPQMAAVVPASLNPPPQSLQRRRRGPKRRRVSGHPMTIRQALLASGRRPHDRSPTRLLMPRISSVSGSQQPPAQLPSPPILDTASAECANQVKKKVKDYLLSRMRMKSGNFSSSDMPPQPPPQPPPPPPPPPPAVMAKSCRLILPKPPSVQASTADTCQIASDLILSELRSRRRDQQVQQQQQQQDMPALVLALQSSQASSASSSLLSFLSGLQATNCMETSISPPAGCNADLPTDDAITMAAPAAAADDYQIQSPLPPPPASIAAAELSIDTNQPPATQPKMELDDD
uniref:Myb-like domain-containing protein n=1 Tax=Macrostomum lignano TaxID=282301 RepID=A0A1I8IQT7_9PLAT